MIENDDRSHVFMNFSPFVAVGFVVELLDGSILGQV